MIFKYLLSTTILLFACIYVCLYSQNTNSKVQFDVDSLPVFLIDTINEKYVYFTKNGGEINVSMNFQYIGGYQSLSKYCDSIYFNRPDYDHLEYNASALYTILFDNNLKIKEIRILKRIGYDNVKYGFDDLITQILLSTDGKWRKKNNCNNQQYLYVGLFKLR